MPDDTRRSARLSARTSTQTAQPPTTTSKKRRRSESDHATDSSLKRNKPASSPQLPSELLIPIFKDAAAYEPPLTSIAIAQVSRAWRSVACGIASLWSDTSHLASLASETQEKCTKVDTLFKLCAKRSRGRLTHANVASLAVSNYHRDVLHRSVKTLVDLRISDRLWCWCTSTSSSRSGAVHLRDKPCRQKDGSVSGTVHDDVIRLVARANSKLQHLHLDLTLPRDVYHCWSSQELSELRVPRLKTLTVLLDNPDTEPNTGTPAWLDWLAAGVPQLECSASLKSEAGLDWVKRTISNKRQELVTLRLYVPVDHVLANETLKMPLLTRLTLGYPRTFDPRQSWYEAPEWGALEAPALREIRIFAAEVLRVQCPEMTCAYLTVSNAADLSCLTTCLAAWPKLEVLTIQMETETRWRPKRDGSWNTRALRSILHLLMQIDKATGTVCVPRLRHLGIVFRCPEPRGAAVEESMSWASMPWTPHEQQHQYRKLFNDAKGKSIRNPWLDAALDKLESQRRTLSSQGGLEADSGSAGLTSASSTAAARPGCVPLATIKLAGLRVRPDHWKTLKRNSGAHLMCYPDPLA